MNFNQTINFDVQNKVYKQLVRTKKTFPANNINYQTCLKVLESFYALYDWNKAEKKLQNKNSLKYYAVLMNEWINGFSLNQIINQTIDWKATNNYTIQVNYNEYVPFNKQNKAHINIIIEQIIEDIEYILRFLLEKYFNHYYQILVKILGENKAGENWATLYHRFSCIKTAPKLRKKRQG